MSPWIASGLDSFTDRSTLLMIVCTREVPIGTLTGPSVQLDASGAVQGAASGLVAEKKKELQGEVQKRVEEKKGEAVKEGRKRAEDAVRGLFK